MMFTNLVRRVERRSPMPSESERPMIPSPGNIAKQKRLAADPPAEQDLSLTRGGPVTVGEQGNPPTEQEGERIDASEFGSAGAEIVGAAYAEALAASEARAERAERAVKETEQRHNETIRGALQPAIAERDRALAERDEAIKLNAKAVATRERALATLRELVEAAETNYRFARSPALAKARALLDKEPDDAK